MPWVAQELPKAEAVGIQQKMYQVLNLHLAIVCQLMEYSNQQWTWPDSAPLEVMAEVYQGIEPSQWYQSQLTEIILPSQNPPLAIPIID